MLNLKLIRCLKYENRRYVHYMRDVNISYVTNDKTRNVMTVNLHIGGSYRKYDTFDVLVSDSNIRLLNKLGDRSLSNTVFVGTLVVDHDNGEIFFLDDIYCDEVTAFGYHKQQKEATVG